MSKKKVSREGYGALERFLPEATLPLLTPLLEGHSVLIKVKQARESKFGDYRPLQDAAWQHQITINNNLNPYAFMVTLVHEIAHMHAFVQYKNKIRPHGKEWKGIYASLLDPFIQPGLLPDDICRGLTAHLASPTASSCTDHTLFTLLKRYDTHTSPLVLLSSLQEGEKFRWRNGLVFQKNELLRKRYKCLELKTRRPYLFHPMAEVERLDI